MEYTLGRKFLKVSLIFFAITVTVGAIYCIRPIRDIIIVSRYMIDFHSHLSLIGWVSMAILGLIYCCLEDKKIPYDDSFGNKGFLFLVAGSIMMPFMLLLTGFIHAARPSLEWYDNTPVVGLTAISAIILVIGAYLSIYNIYKALSMSN